MALKLTAEGKILAGVALSTAVAGVLLIPFFNKPKEDPMAYEWVLATLVVAALDGDIKEVEVTRNIKSEQACDLLSRARMERFREDILGSSGREIYTICVARKNLVTEPPAQTHSRKELQS